MGSAFEFRSEMALRVYRQVFFGVDAPLGYTLDVGSDGSFQTVRIPAGIDWYVRHEDDRLPDEFIRPLVDEVRQKTLMGLSLASCRFVSDAGFRQLGPFERLEILDLFNTGLDDDALEHLKPIPTVRSLNLAGTEISDRAGPLLLERFPRLEKLHLGFTGVTDAILDSVARLGTLRMLDLRNTAVTDEGMTRIGTMTALTTLGLQETELGDRGITNLRRLTPTLERLYLGYTQVTDACVEDLMSFAGLRTLMLRATRIARTKDDGFRRALSRLGGEGTGPDGVQEGLIR